MVDQRERSNDQEEAMRIGQDRHAQQLWTFLPVIVKEDSKGHTVDLRPAIKGWQRNQQTGETEAVEITYLGDCPVHFVQGGEFVITHPVKKDDEAVVAFSTRCIDGWWDEGGVQAEPYRRSHHLSDGMYIGGVRSNPRALGGNPKQNGQRQRASNDSRAPSTSTIQIRTEKGDHYIELTGTEQQGRSPIDIIIPEPFADGQEAIEGRPGPLVNIVCVRCNIKASEKVHFDTPLFETTGEIRAKGEITAKTDVAESNDYGRSARSRQNIEATQIARLTPTPRAGDSVALSTHRHSDVESGNAQTGQPVPGS